jgi:hypothetical protein
MGFFFLLSGLLFGGAVRDLGDPHFPTRLAAVKRLSSAGWLAYPALLDGVGSPVVERSAKSADLIDALPSAGGLVERLADVAVAGLVASPKPVPELTPRVWLVMEMAVCRAAEGSAPVQAVSLDGQRRTEVSGNFVFWVRSVPWYGNDHPGEIRVLAEAVRAKRQAVKGE